MRLIDVDELIKVLKQRATNENIMGYMTAYDVTNSIIDEVEEQPTAYEINKVVEELNEAKTISVDIGFGTIIDTIRKDVVLEIVKQGCTSDDCCEWKYDEHFEFAKSDCGSMDTHRIDFRKLKYCPYCRKKIKVVE